MLLLPIVRLISQQASPEESVNNIYIALPTNELNGLKLFFTMRKREIT